MGDDGDTGPTLADVQTELERLVRLRWDHGLSASDEATYEQLVAVERELLTGRDR